jgi:hypothetical protein
MTFTSYETVNTSPPNCAYASIATSRSTVPPVALFDVCGYRTSFARNCFNGRGGGIRTPDPLVPNQMRYQTALRPDSF